MNIGAEPLSYPFGEAIGIDPHPRYAELRRDAPVCRVRLPYGEDGWLVTRHEDVQTVLTDPRFSRAAAAGRDLPRVEEALQIGRYSMSSMPAAEHARLRMFAGTGLTLRKVERLRPRIEQIASGLVAGMRRSGPPADLITSFAHPLPITVISELLAVPEADRAAFSVWADTINATTAVSAEAVMIAGGRIRAYVGGLIAERRQCPGDDLLSSMIATRDERGQLTDEELTIATMAVLVGGYTTIANMIANSVYALLVHPDQLELIRRDEGLMPRAVEELLRFVAGLATAAIQHRVAVADAELSGTCIKAGDVVMVARAAANRDERVFSGAERLDLRREKNPHLTFGHGAHYCVGASLARMELQAGLGALIRGLPGIAFAVPEAELRWRTGRPIRGLAALPVNWSTHR